MSDKSDELGRHFGTLLKTAMAGFGTMRELVVRSTQTGRLRVDIALLSKERSQLLQALGETVMQLVDDGAFPLDEAPESVRQACERIKDVEGQLRSDRIKVSDNAFGAPRGYEPEAATDYGDSDGGADDERDAEDARDHAASSTSRSTGAASEGKTGRAKAGAKGPRSSKPRATGTAPRRGRRTDSPDRTRR